jgi:hypothetical protein
MLNRANSGDRQYVRPGDPVDFAHVTGNQHQFQGLGGRNYRNNLNGHANDQGAQNATAAAANINQRGPTNNATFSIVSQRPPTPREERRIGNVHRVGQVGRVYLYAPGPAPQ